MTKEEYKKIKKDLIESMIDFPIVNEVLAIMKKYIKEQEPFDVAKYCEEHWVVMVDRDVYEDSKKKLKEQEPKVGQWIDTNDDGFVYHRVYKCVHCGFTVFDYPENIQNYKYCSNCGARMSEVMRWSNVFNHK